MNGLTKYALMGLAPMALWGCSNDAETAQMAETKQATQGSDTPFVAADFSVPKQVQADGFQLIPLGPELAQADYDAYYVFDRPPPDHF